MSTSTKMRTTKRSALTPTIKAGARPRHDVVRVCAYLRVSQDTSGRLRSIEEQWGYIQTLCDARGWKIVAVFDDGEFATGNEDDEIKRPKFREMIEFIKGGGADMLVTWMSSRAGRGKPARDLLASTLKRHHVEWCYEGNVIDLNNPTDEFTNSVQQAVDIKYKEELRANVGKALLANAAAGAAHGRTPFGYDRVSIGRKHQTNVPNGDARFVRSAVEMYLAGESVRAITAWLNAERPLESKPATSKRAATCGAWVRAGVRAMISSPTYCGWRSYKGTIVVDDETGEPIEAWEPIISVKQHLDVVDLMRHQAACTPNKGNDRRHLLSGVAICGVCDLTLDARRVGVSRDGKGFATYTCSSKHGHVVIDEARTDKIVSFGVIDRIKTQFRKADPTRSARHAHVDDMIAMQRMLIDENTAALAVVGTNKVALSRAIEAAEQEIERLDKSRPTRNVRPSTVDQLIAADDAHAEFERFTLEQQSALLRSLVRVTIMPTTAKRGTFDAQRIVVQWLDDEGSVIS